MKTPELKNNNNLSGFICCHKLSGYLLLPIRLAIFAIFNVINLIVIILNVKGILPYDLIVTKLTEQLQGNLLLE